MTTAIGFPPVAGADARVLILGSMPSQRSLAEQQYYAHPRNAFWPIMAELLGFSPGVPYPDRLHALQANRIALWDVLQACRRPGSLDARIIAGSMVVNDFARFFRAHPAVRAVFFNGAKAEQMYRRHVLPALSGSPAGLPLLRLPSTSPAHAAMSVIEKQTRWRRILDDCAPV